MENPRVQQYNLCERKHFKRYTLQGSLMEGDCLGKCFYQVQKDRHTELLHLSSKGTRLHLKLEAECSILSVVLVLKSCKIQQLRDHVGLWFQKAMKPDDVWQCWIPYKETLRDLWSYEGEAYNSVEALECWRWQKHEWFTKESCRHWVELAQDRGHICFRKQESLEHTWCHHESQRYGASGFCFCLCLVWVWFLFVCCFCLYPLGIGMFTPCYDILEVCNRSPSFYKGSQLRGCCWSQKSHWTLDFWSVWIKTPI